MYQPLTVTIKEVENGYTVRFHDFVCGYGKEFVQHDLNAVFELIAEKLKGECDDAS